MKKIYKNCRCWCCFSTNSHIKAFFIIVFLTAFRSANAQLEFFEFGFNIYENNTRIAEQNKFQVMYYATYRKTNEVLEYIEVKPSADTSRSLGYDYLFDEEGGMLRDYIVNVLIIKENKDTMNVEFNYPESSAWVMLGIDKLSLSPGKFRITCEQWPYNSRQRYKDNRYFPFLDKNFDWEKVRNKTLQSYPIFNFNQQLPENHICFIKRFI